MLEARYEPTPTLLGQPYTSARVRTWGKYSVAPSPAHPTVRIEARIQLPRGAGLWAAFWMLPAAGSNAGCSGCGGYGTWAASGEIDIMEAANDMPAAVGTIHFAGQWPANAYYTARYSQPAGASLADGYHVYALEWEAKQMRWYVDGALFSTQYSGNGTRGGWFSLGEGAGADAPFDRVRALVLQCEGVSNGVLSIYMCPACLLQPFHLLLDLALGGPGSGFTMTNGVGVSEAALRATLARPKRMLVDYVRVYGKPKSRVK